MSLRTSDRRHWCGSPPVGWKQLGFTAKMFENPGDCARRKYPWGTTPACALVRNDRAFSNSPTAFCGRCGPTVRLWSTGRMAVFLTAQKSGKVDNWVFCQPKISTAVKYAVEIFSQFPKKCRK